MIDMLLARKMALDATFFSLINQGLPSPGIMDRMVIPCKQCGRPLAALPTMASRKCAACGATTRIPAARRAQPLSPDAARDAISAGAKPAQLDPGKTIVVKRRAAKPITSREDDA